MNTFYRRIAVVLIFALTISSCVKTKDSMYNIIEKPAIISQLKSNGLFNIVIPHRINDLKRMNMIKDLGFRGWELDLRFYIEDSIAVFKVEHDEGTSNAINLDSYLQNAGMQNVDKLWFDLKNLNDNTLDGVYNRLSVLDSIYDLKSKIILETSFTSQKVERFRNAGWHTSYYLPHLTIEGWIKANDTISQQNYSITLANQLIKQDVAAVSFDVAAIYSFVVKYLEPKINQDIVYHCWDTSEELNDTAFIDKYLKKVYSGNSRIKTVLIPIY